MSFVIGEVDALTQAHRITVLDNQTLTATGATAVGYNFGDCTEVFMVVRIAGPVTGTTPTLLFTLNEVDPSNGTSLTGNSVSSATFTSTTTPQVYRLLTNTGAFQLNRTVGGTTPSFGGVFVTLVGRLSSDKVEGKGTAGAPSGGVVSVQGVSGGQLLPVSVSGTANTNLIQIGSNTVVTGGVNGSLGVGGLAAHGAANAGNPLLLGVVDTPAGNIYRMLGDSSGRLIVTGAAAEGAAEAGNPVLVSGGDISGNVRAVQVLNADPVPATYGLVVRTMRTQRSTFTAIATGVVLGNNKSMLGVLVGGAASNILRLSKVYLRNAQSTAVTGVVTSFELRRLTNLTGGTAVTPVQMDTADAALGGSITCVTNGTATETSLIDRWQFSSDEFGAGTLDQEGAQKISENFHPVWGVGNNEERMLTARANQGWHIKCATNTTAGTWDIMFVFVQE